MSRSDGDIKGMAAFGVSEWSSGERSEPERNGEAPKARGGSAGQAPNPEVSARPLRRRFTAAYKARIVEEAARCTTPGEIGALLRREGLYSSLLSKWREQSHRGMLKELTDDKRGRKPTKNPLADEVARLERENRRLQRRLEQAETIIEIQKKVSSILGITLPTESDRID